MSDVRLFRTWTIGLCGKSGRPVHVNYSFKKKIASAETPMCDLFIPMLNEAADLCRWPSVEAMLADLRDLAECAKQIYESERRSRRKAGGEA